MEGPGASHRRRLEGSEVLSRGCPSETRLSFFFWAENSTESSCLRTHQSGVTVSVQAAPASAKIVSKMEGTGAQWFNWSKNVNTEEHQKLQSKRLRNRGIVARWVVTVWVRGHDDEFRRTLPSWNPDKTLNPSNWLCYHLNCIHPRIPSSWNPILTNSPEASNREPWYPPRMPSSNTLC